MIAEGHYDIRLMGPYLLGSFIDGGMPAMPVVFESLVATLTTNWAVFGPERRKQNLADNGVRWLLKMLLKLLEFHERQKDDTWRSWMESQCRMAMSDALDHASAVESAINQALPAAAGGATDLFRRVTKWLAETVRVMSTQVVPSPAQPETSEEESKDDAPAAPEPRPAAAAPGVPISLAMAALLRKLRAFEELVKKEDFLKAGVVAADLLGIVESFDPRVYLPSIFAGFYAGLSAHIESLEPVLMNNESLAQKALTQLYRMDLDTFLKLGE